MVADLNSPKRKRGHPSSFTQAIANEICDRLSAGESLRTILKSAHLPDENSILRWLRDPERADFRGQYASAREAQAERYAEEIVSIADDSSRDFVETEDGPKPNPEMVNRARLRVDARKWVAAKLLPKKYGDHVSLEVTGALGLGVVAGADLARLISEVASSLPAVPTPAVKALPGKTL